MGTSAEDCDTILALRGRIMAQFPAASNRVAPVDQVWSRLVLSQLNFLGSDRESQCFVVEYSVEPAACQPKSDA